MRVFNLAGFLSDYNTMGHNRDKWLRKIFLHGVGVDRVGKLLPIHAGDYQCPTLEDFLDNIRALVFWDKLAPRIGADVKHFLQYKIADSELTRAHFSVEGAGHAFLIALPVT